MYGTELVLDLHGCDVTTFNRMSLDTFFEELCEEIDMVQCERFWWDDVGVPEAEKQTSPHTTGTSAVQFILTSSIVVHTLDLLGNAYVNIFSCKDFDHDIAARFAAAHFKGMVAQRVSLNRL
jgi:S-adenosylmethionine/arginine decarboxylase-like enzyme